MVLPTEGGGSSSVATSTTLARGTATALLASVVSGATDALSIGTNVKVALLSSAPGLNVSTGVWDISGHELTTGTAPGYARASVARQTGFGTPTGAAPVSSSNVSQVLFAPASADWPVVSHVALLNNAGTVVFTVFELPEGLQVTSGNSARIPVNKLKFAVPSI